MVTQTHGLPSLQTRYIKTMHQLGCCIHGSQWHHVKVLFRAGIPWTRQLVLSWSRIPQARLRDTWAHLGSHICINAFDSIFFQSNGPKPWYGHLVGNLDIRTPSERQMVHQYSPYPLMYQNTQIWKNLNEFWNLEILDTSVRPVRVDQWSRNGII